MDASSKPLRNMALESATEHQARGAELVVVTRQSEKRCHQKWRDNSRRTHWVTLTPRPGTLSPQIQTLVGLGCSKRPTKTRFRPLPLCLMRFDVSVILETSYSIPPSAFARCFLLISSSDRSTELSEESRGYHV